MITKLETFHQKLNWSITQSFKNTFNYKGRATRWEFFAFNVFISALIHLSEKLDSVLLPGNNWQPISNVTAIVLFFPALAVGVRRLHDAGFSGWWIILGLVPIFLYPMVGLISLLGFIPYLVLVLKKGTPGKNRFGPPIVIPTIEEAKLVNKT